MGTPRCRLQFIGRSRSGTYPRRREGVVFGVRRLSGQEQDQRKQTSYRDGRDRDRVDGRVDRRRQISRVLFPEDKPVPYTPVLESCLRSDVQYLYVSCLPELSIFLFHRISLCLPPRLGYPFSRSTRGVPDLTSTKERIAVWSRRAHTQSWSSRPPSRIMYWECDDPYICDPKDQFRDYKTPGTFDGSYSSGNISSNRP